MDALPAALADAGGVRAPRERGGQLRTLLLEELAHGRSELSLARSGRERPVVVAFAAEGGSLLAVAPAPAALRADQHAADERTWLLVAAAVGALVEAAPAGHAGLRAGELDGHLLLALQGEVGGEDAELAAMAFEEQIAHVDRLRARAVALPGHVLESAVRELREPIGATHPLRVAEAVAGLGGRPADPGSGDEHEDAVLAMLAGDGSGPAVARPHDDPEPARRIARRVLQRLDGMGKWGGYHTEFAHLARGFAGNDRALAEEVGEALLQAGLLSEKPSVGQRHVFLNSRRAGDIRRLIDDGVVPSDLRLP
jgi:hypothetical protein